MSLAAAVAKEEDQSGGAGGARTWGWVASAESALACAWANHLPDPADQNGSCNHPHAILGREKHKADPGFKPKH